MTAQRINLHAWPGRGNASRAPAAGDTPGAERFADRPGIVLVAAAERDVLPETWGLGIALSVHGPTVSGASLIVPDGLAGDQLAALRTWAASVALATPSGHRRVRVTTRTAWCDPDGSGLIGAYKGGRWFVTADEGRSLGLLVDWRGPAMGRFRGGFSLGLPGWGAPGEWRTRRGRSRSGWRARLHEPALRVKALGGHGLIAQWGRAGRRGLTPDGQEAGHWEGKRGQRKPFGGRIVDLVGPAHAFDGLDTGDLGEHLGAFGLPPVDLPAEVPVTPESAAQLLDVASSVHQLALALDTEAGRWLMTREDHRAGIARLTLRRIVSPGSVAARILDASGATPPLSKFSSPDDPELDRWQSAGHGGWVTADLRGQVVPVADVDVRSAYPSAWVLLDVWGALTARQLRHVDVAEKLRTLCVQVAAGDLSPLYDPATYGDLGLTLAEVLPDGELWPVERPGKRGPRFDVAALRSSSPMLFGWPDVVGAAASSGRVPHIVSATRLLPVGKEDGLRSIPLRDGLVVPAGEDPVPWLVRLRPDKGAGQDLLRGCIRGVANPLAWGIFARLDQYRVDGELRERATRWSWPPVATTVPAVVRMWLGMIERPVRSPGGAIVARDTDGNAILSSPDGGDVELRDGRTVRALSWSQVDDLLRPFGALDPFGDGKPFWSVDRERGGRPLHMLALAPKRYVVAIERQGGGYTAIGGTEHSLGGGVVDPPALRGRDEDRRHVWTLPVAQRALDIASGHAREDWTSPWDGSGDPFPVLRRFTVGSFDALRELPACLGAHPFAPLVEGQPDKLFGDTGSPVALDPGDDLAGWQRLDWRNAAGESTRVDVRAGRDAGVVFRVLDDWALGWCLPVTAEAVELVDVDARLVRRVGRGGALIDALLADPGADPKEHQVIYDEGDPAGYVSALVQAMGRKPFAAAFGIPGTTVHRIARGAGLNEATLHTVLDAIAAGKVVPTRCSGCGHEVWRPGAKVCSSACRETTKARRHRGSGGVTMPVCALPDCTRPARGRSETCTPAHKKRLARLRVREGADAGTSVEDAVWWRPTLDPVTGLRIGPWHDFGMRARPATPMPWDEVFPDWEHPTEPEPDVETFPEWWQGYAPSDRWPA